MKQLSFGPQKNVISLEEGMNRTRNWRDAIKNLYGNDEAKIPHAIFIPLEDINELQQMAADINNSTRDPLITVVGIRAYFSLVDPLPPSTEDITEGNALTAVLVLAYQKNPRHRGEKGEFAHHGDHDTFDLIVPVASAGSTRTDRHRQVGDEETYTIYDITRPCPNLCDVSSQLYGPLIVKRGKKEDTGHDITGL